MVTPEFELINKLCSFVIHLFISQLVIDLSIYIACKGEENFGFVLFCCVGRSLEVPPFPP